MLNRSFTLGSVIPVIIRFNRRPPQSSSSSSSSSSSLVVVVHLLSRRPPPLSSAAIKGRSHFYKRMICRRRLKPVQSYSWFTTAALPLPSSSLLPNTSFAVGPETDDIQLAHFLGPKDKKKLTDKDLLHAVLSGSINNKDSRVEDDGYIYIILEYGQIDLSHMMFQKWKEMDGSNQTIDENWLRFY